MRKRQCSHYLENIFLIKNMMSVILCVAITTLKLLKFVITTTMYVLMSLPCMTSSSFTLRLFIGWFSNNYFKFSHVNVSIWLFCLKYLLCFILLIFWFRRSDLNSEIWYIFQIHFTKNKLLHTDPQLLRKCKFCDCRLWEYRSIPVRLRTRL